MALHYPSNQTPPIVKDDAGCMVSCRHGLRTVVLAVSRFAVYRDRACHIFRLWLLGSSRQEKYSLLLYLKQKFVIFSILRQNFGHFERSPTVIHTDLPCSPRSPVHPVVHLCYHYDTTAPSMLTPNSKLHTRGPARRGIGVATPIKAGQYVAASAKPKKFPVLLVLLVLFGGLLMWQGSRPLHRSSSMYYSATGSSSGSDLDLMHVLTSYSGSGNNNNVDAGVLGVPSGQAVPLPNERLVDKTVEDKRQEGNYGGMGDSTHLGGFATGLDLQYISPKLWTHMVKTYNIKSVLDLGCGLGHASAWFDTHGVRTKCVDGSADALSHSVIAPERQSDILVEHDFARGPW